MARIESQWANNGLALIHQYILDLTPKRVRVYFCATTAEIVVRPRVTSQNTDTMIVKNSDLRAAWDHVQSWVPREQMYWVDRMEWSEDRTSIPSPGFR